MYMDHVHRQKTMRWLQLALRGAVTAGGPRNSGVFGAKSCILAIWRHLISVPFFHYSHKMIIKEILFHNLLCSKKKYFAKLSTRQLVSGNFFIKYFDLQWQSVADPKGPRGCNQIGAKRRRERVREGDNPTPLQVGVLGPPLGNFLKNGCKWCTPSPFFVDFPL